MYLMDKLHGVVASPRFSRYSIWKIDAFRQYVLSFKFIERLCSTHVQTFYGVCVILNKKLKVIQKLLQ